ncbi:MAG: hypothetical protein MMC33_009928 [Icmadophila ericetorum]|nr:hypothetical protein [Icmadophila ericetorum]
MDSTSSKNFGDGYPLMPIPSNPGTVTYKSPPIEFFSLPPEIRNNIYHFCLVLGDGPFIIGQITDDNGFRMGMTSSVTGSMKDFNAAAEESRIKLACHLRRHLPDNCTYAGPRILLVNKEINAQATPIFYGGNSFQFRTWELFQCFFCTAGYPNCKLLRNLELCYPSKDPRAYSSSPTAILSNPVNFPSLNSYNYSWATNCFVILTTLVNLRTLTLTVMGNVSQENAEASEAWLCQIPREWDVVLQGKWTETLYCRDTAAEKEEEVLLLPPRLTRTSINHGSSLHWIPITSTPTGSLNPNLTANITTAIATTPNSNLHWTTLISAPIPASSTPPPPGSPPAPAASHPIGSSYSAVTNARVHQAFRKARVSAMRLGSTTAIISRKSKEKYESKGWKVKEGIVFS